MMNRICIFTQSIRNLDYIALECIKLFQLDLMVDDQTDVGVVGLVGTVSAVGHPTSAVTRLE